MTDEKPTTALGTGMDGLTVEHLQKGLTVSHLSEALGGKTPTPAAAPAQGSTPAAPPAPATTSQKD